MRKLAIIFALLLPSLGWAQTITFRYFSGAVNPNDCVRLDPAATLVNLELSDSGVPCGTGGTISGLTPGVIPKAGSATTVIDSKLSDDGTTATYTGTGGLALSAGPMKIGASPPTACGSSPQCIAFNESGTAGTPTAGQDYMRADSVTHKLLCSFNNGAEAACSGAGGSGGNPTLDNCTPDQTGNSFYSVGTLTNYFFASWQFIFNTTTYINCTVFVPTVQTGATLVLDISANDATAGHTANFQTCDGVINSGTINIGSLTCAANQTFTTTSTAYNRVTLTFNVQSTLANNSILVVKIATSPTGTAPTANLLVQAHFIL
jgi:hypothetical protein